MNGLNSTDGKDGVNGLPGINGKDGISSTIRTELTEGWLQPLYHCWW
jgi:hypothetical protein